MADDTSEPAPGISEALAMNRAMRIGDLRYGLTLSIPANPQDPVRGRARLSFNLTDASRGLALDFAPEASGSVLRASVNGADAERRVHRGHLLVAPALLRDGHNEIDLTFVAGDRPLNRREDLLYSLFVPARAHEAIPCFDQPSVRARWSLSLEIPLGWSVVANGPEVSRQPVTDSSSGPDASRPAGRSVDTSHHAARIVVTFAETEPIPTYLLAFAAGQFSVESRRCAGRAMQILHRESDPKILAGALDAIAQLHEHSLSWLERYTGIPYPFAKLDAVVVPAFQFSGMEHPGAVYYNAAAVMLDESATNQQLLARAHLIAHETTHMWFGDLVTMRWFSDVWMKEVFANFLAQKIVATLFPDTDHGLAFLHAHYPQAYDVDRTAGSNPIRQPLDNLLHAASLYGPIVYLKSPIVMRQLEAMIGADALCDALREFLQQYRYASASWPDLLALLKQRSPVDLEAWSRDWIDEPGRPLVQTTLAERDGRIERLALETLAPATASMEVRFSTDRIQREPLGPPGRRWPQQLTIALGYSGRVEHLPVYLDGHVEVRAAAGRPVPDFVLPNGRGLGYGAFRLDPKTRGWLLANLPSIEDALTRASAWITLWEALLDDELAVEAFVDLALGGISSESSSLTTTRILACLEKAFWIFLSPSERDEYAPLLERALRDGIDRSTAVPLKAAFLATLRAVATSDGALQWLEALWHRDEAIPGLPLGESDRIALVLELAVRDRPRSDGLVQSQIDHTADPDRRAALLFLQPALSSQPAERDRFFTSLRDVANRRREPLVVEGLRWLHHPLRDRAAVPYIEPGLAMLEEVQRTGDIFFPKRWADAVLSGHRSPDAAQIVRRFLASRPAGYPDTLRRIVLVAADSLMRAQRGTSIRAVLKREP